MKPLLNEWKLALGLCDWRISVFTVKPGAIGENVGYLNYWEDETPPRARIRIVASPHVDAELTLVHELLHLVFICFPPIGVAGADHQESVIDNLAVALVTPKRNARLAE